MRLKSKARFFNEKTKEAFYKLKFGDDKDRKLFLEINKAIDKIEADAFCGVQIPKDLIPAYYKKRAKINNLWKFNLAGGWRLIYSIINDKVVIISIIFEWFSHPDYEKRFGY